MKKARFTHCKFAIFTYHPYSIHNKYNITQNQIHSHSLNSQFLGDTLPHVTLSPPLYQSSPGLSPSSAFPTLPSAAASLLAYDGTLQQPPLCPFDDQPIDPLAIRGGLCDTLKAKNNQLLGELFLKIEE